MDMDTIGAALKRKLGPLPVWAWAIVGGIVVYFLRSRGYLSSSLGSDSGTALEPSQQSATTPQPPTVLQPGESAYDPNSGTLTTAPGGGDTGTGTGASNSDIGQAIEDLAAAMQAGQTSQAPAQNASAPRVSALDRAKAAVVTGKIGPVNRGRLRKEGYTNAQINFHLKAKTPLGATESAKRAAKKKPAHAAPTNSTKTSKHTSTKSRSSASTRTPTGGRTTSRQKKPVKITANARTSSVAHISTVRQRPTIAVIGSAASVQHPTSTHRKTSHPVSESPPRPSAPAPRALRTAPARHTNPPVTHKSSPPKKRKR